MSRFSFINYTVRSVLRLHPGGRLRFLSYSVKKTVECTQCGKDKKYRARKKLKLKKDQRRVEALTGRVEELEKQVCLLEDALSRI